MSKEPNSCGGGAIPSGVVHFNHLDGKRVMSREVE